MSILVNIVIGKSYFLVFADYCIVCGAIQSFEAYNSVQYYNRADNGIL